MSNTNWKEIKANSNLIKTETSSAVLIKCPKTDWLFWHPSKCVKTAGKSDYLMVISYTNDFKFKIFREGKNFTKLDEKEISVSEFELMFGNTESLFNSDKILVELKKWFDSERKRKAGNIATKELQLTFDVLKGQIQSGKEYADINDIANALLDFLEKDFDVKKAQIENGGICEFAENDNFGFDVIIK